MTGSVPRVRVEFYGLARLRAGVANMQVEAATLGSSMALVSVKCPDLRPVLDGRLAPEYLVSLDGVRFTTDLGRELADGECVLVLGADAGG